MLVRMSLQTFVDAILYCYLRRCQFDIPIRSKPFLELVTVAKSSFLDQSIHQQLSKVQEGKGNMGNYCPAS